MKLNRRTLALAALYLVSQSALAGGNILQEITETYALDKGATISLDNINGDVRIEGWEGNDLRLTYRIIGRSEKALDRVKVRISDDPRRFRIEADYTKSNSWFGNNDGASVEFDLMVPASAILDKVETVNGSLSIKGVHGEVDAETVNGDIEARGLHSDAKLGTVNGSIEAWFERFEDQQRVSLESVNGRLTVYIPEDADVEVKAETVHGSLKNDFGLNVEKGFVGSDLRGRLGSGSARLNLDTVNGSISIRSN